MNTQPWGSRLLRKRLLGTDPAEGLELLGGASLGSPSDEHSQCSERCCGSLSCSDQDSPPACPSLTFIYFYILRFCAEVHGVCAGPASAACLWGDASAFPPESKHTK